MVRTAGRPTVPVSLNEEERSFLENQVRDPRVARVIATHCRIILRCADGMTNRAVASELGVNERTVSMWRYRFLEDRIDGLSDGPHKGRRQPLTDEKVAEVVERTLHTTPAHATRWSARSMARETRVSHSSVRRIWTAFGMYPHRWEPCALSVDPLVADKVRDIVGLRLSPPGRAMVFCVDRHEHASRTQALDHTQPVLPMAAFVREWRSLNSRCYDTQSLLVALDAATGFDMGEDCTGERSGELLQFLEVIDRRVPDDLDLHIVVDNAAHNVAAIETWLAQRSRWKVNVAPTSAAWANQVERWFAELMRKELQRGANTSKHRLEAKIRDFLEAQAKSPRPFKWTKPSQSGLSWTNLEDETLDSKLNGLQQAALYDLIGMFNCVDGEALDRAVQALVHARLVLVVGAYSAYSVAVYLHEIACMQLRNWHIVDYYNSNSVRSLPDLTPADVVVGIETNPYGAYTTRVAKLARRVGARVIGITDWTEAPVAAYANDVLLVSPRKPSMLASHLATTALAEVLVRLVAARSGG